MRRKVHLRQAGSGLNLTLFAGAAEAFEDADIGFETIAGTSGGGVTGAALASGMPAKELQDLLLSFMPPVLKVMDPVWPPGLSLLLSKGLFHGEKLEKELAKHVAKTFGQTKVPFACFTANMQRKTSVEWSTTRTPDAPLAHRAVAGGRLPVAFKPAMINGEPHRDGGLLRNYPIDFKFPGQSDVIPTIGLCFRSTVGEAAPIKSLGDDLSACLDMLLASTAREHVEDAAWARTIILEPAGSALDFGKGPDKAKADFKAGYGSTLKWLEKYGSTIFTKR